jgi:rRNA-processing protein CGR1
MQPALKSKSFSDRMEKASKALAIKKLQAELKEEKEAEIQRCDPLDTLSAHI